MADVPKPGRPLRFGIFELDPESGELRKAGVAVGLQDQSLKVLMELLERPGDLVTRDRLRQCLWPDGTFVDFEHGLNAVINRLRETLGDSADSPRFIQTVPRRGYRFIAPVQGAAVSVAAAEALLAMLPLPLSPATVESPTARVPAPLTVRDVVVPPLTPPTESRPALTVTARELPLSVTAPVPISRSLEPVKLKSSFQA